ncbi:NOL1/NOP2/sun family protein [Streptococcus pneumoniae]|nr:NOL1/NOP2/sun family protein [Streptococcus pneumoniae]VQM34077.1 NOL1/NOP2/sun family protein [Streptococcus pneumoniae]
MQFPEGFVEKYKEILGDEARDFLASFEEEAVSAFRVNPLGLSGQSLKRRATFLF